jgi:Protein of unknown function (DUF2631)
VALHPGSEYASEGEPEDYAEHHPTEHPSEWGWHGEWGRTARIAGWVVVVILVVMITATHYNGTGTLSLIAFAAALVIALVWDINRRRTSWRQ